MSPTVWFWPEEARAAVLAHVQALAPAVCSLRAAGGRTLAEAVRADRDLPAADRSSMDGYAFARRGEDRAPLRLRVTGEIPAGAPPATRPGSGECVRIFTGALLPPGTDTVVMQEDTEAEGTDVVVRAVPERGAYVLRQGTDARAGDVLVAAGTRLSPLHVALCATAGRTTVSVVPRPTAAILTTGDELRDPGEPLEPWQIRDSNRELVAAQLRAAGFEVVAVRRTDDDEARMAAAAAELLDAAHALVLIGGMSVGQYDFAPAALRRIGAEIRFHRMRARPGKPQLFATRGRQLIFGLPGNPLSVMVGLHELALPALRALAGRPAEECRCPIRARLAGPVEGLAELVNYRPARLRWTERGPEAEVLSTPRSSADMLTASGADGLAVIPAGARLQAGDWVEFLAWEAGA